MFLYIGDHDPSGEDIRNAFHEDVRAFAEQDAPGAEIEFVRVALLPEQVTDDTPSQPPKSHENQCVKTRLERWYADGNDETYQVEALPPDRLTEIIEDAVREHTDLDALAQVRRAEREARDWLKGEFEQRFGEVT